MVILNDYRDFRDLSTARIGAIIASNGSLKTWQHLLMIDFQPQKRYSPLKCMGVHPIYNPYSFLSSGELWSLNQQRKLICPFIIQENRFHYRWIFSEQLNLIASNGYGNSTQRINHIFFFYEIAEDLDLGTHHRDLIFLDHLGICLHNRNLDIRANGIYFMELLKQLTHVFRAILDYVFKDADYREFLNQST